MNLAQVSPETLYSGGLAWWIANEPVEMQDQVHGVRLIVMEALDEIPCNISGLAERIPNVGRKQILYALTRLYRASKITRSGSAGHYRYKRITTS